MAFAGSSWAGALQEGASLASRSRVGSSVVHARASVREVGALAFCLGRRKGTESYSSEQGSQARSSSSKPSAASPRNLNTET